ncbi:hypothetical protein PTKIN_Ptkin14bG0110000 [Pterospermum kingtungense]
MEFGLNMAGKIYNNVTTTHEEMKNLKRKLEELNALKEDMESRRNTELHPTKKLKKEAELWVRNVERINGEILELEQKVGESNVVSRGWGSLTANVLNKKQEVEELLQQGKFQDGLVVDNLGWIGQALSTTTVSGQAAKTCMEEIWAYLMDDGIQKIGVWGMGGVGKTTIMKLINNQLLNEKEKFNIVIWVTVSKEKNISGIQNIIAQAMNEKLHEVVDETIRAGRIHELLARKGKFVLILDDLWDKLSLEEVGIPEPSNGSKLLVTTRLFDVCRYLKCREVKVPTLSEQDAWSLFSEKVGQEVLNHPHLLPIVKSVAKECAGLPLAIVTIASSMNGVCDIHEWSNALNELSRHAPSVNGMEEKVFQQLKFSYDRLQVEKLKNCFLCCALFPEDFNIDPCMLIELWIAEGLVEEMDSLKMEIDRGHAILNKLINSCLVETTTGRYSRNKVEVKLHDVVRDMALRITSVRPRFLVRAGMQLKEIPDVQHWKEDLEKASLMENPWLQIPPDMSPPRCPNLTTLLLSNCYIESIPEGFFEQMHGLKILDLSWNIYIESLPNSISNLKTLTTLLLCQCERLEKVPSFSKLETLKKLDLSWTMIKNIPDGLERLVKLKYLDLNDTQIAEMDDGIMTKLTSLRQLNLITEEGGIWVRGEEIGGLRKLEIFEGRFHDLNNYGQALQLARTIGPRQYRILVGPEAYIDPDYDWDKAIGINGDGIYCTHGIKIPSDVEYLGIRNITVHLSKEEEKEALFCSGFIIPVPHNIFSSLAEIVISEYKNIKKLFSSLHSLQNLKRLRVLECDEMEEIIASESETTSSTTASASASFEFTITLPKLRTLELINLPELKSICGANVQLVCDSIEWIDIANCPKIKRIPLKLPLQDDGQPSPPPSLTGVAIFPKQQWEMVEWDHPNAKSLLNPNVRGNSTTELELWSTKTKATATPSIRRSSMDRKKTLGKGTMPVTIPVTVAFSGLGLATPKALDDSGKWHVIMALLHCYHKLVQGEHSLVLTSLPSILEVDHQGFYLQRAYTIISLKRKLGKELLVTSAPSLTKSGVY